MHQRRASSEIYMFRRAQCTTCTYVPSCLCMPLSGRLLQHDDGILYVSLLSHRQRAPSIAVRLDHGTADRYNLWVAYVGPMGGEREVDGRARDTCGRSLAATGRHSPLACPARTASPCQAAAARGIRRTSRRRPSREARSRIPYRMNAHMGASWGRAERPSRSYTDPPRSPPCRAGPAATAWRPLGRRPCRPPCGRRTSNPPVDVVPSSMQEVGEVEASDRQVDEREHLPVAAAAAAVRTDLPRHRASALLHAAPSRLAGRRVRPVPNPTHTHHHH